MTSRQKADLVTRARERDPDEVAGIILTNEQGKEYTVEFDR